MVRWWWVLVHCDRPSISPSRGKKKIPDKINKRSCPFVAAVVVVVVLLLLTILRILFCDRIVCGGNPRLFCLLVLRSFVVFFSLCLEGFVEA
jgi:hypothetical protein